VSFCFVKWFSRIISSALCWWDLSVGVTDLLDLAVAHKLVSPTSCLNCCTQCLTVITSTHLSPYTACMWRWMSMGGIFFPSEELDNGTLFEPNVLTAFHFDWHWIGVMDSCGFKVMYGGGEMSCDCVELGLFIFLYSIKKYDRSKIFDLSPIEVRFPMLLVFVFKLW
jgi:hypothetical protein